MALFYGVGTVSLTYSPANTQRIFVLKKTSYKPYLAYHNILRITKEFFKSSECFDHDLMIHKLIEPAPPIVNEMDYLPK